MLTPREIAARIMSMQSLLQLLWSAIIAGIIQTYPLFTKGKIDWWLALTVFLTAFAAYLAQNIQQAASEKRVIESTVAGVVDPSRRGSL